MQLDQNTLLVILAVVALIVVVIIIANARRRPPARPLPPKEYVRDRTMDTGDVSIEIRLSRLADLRSKGLITEEEYDRQRSKILGEL